MNRRSFLAALASIPVVGRLVRPEPEPDEWRFGELGEDFLEPASKSLPGTALEDFLLVQDGDGRLSRLPLDRL